MRGKGLLLLIAALLAGVLAWLLVRGDEASASRVDLLTRNAAAVPTAANQLPDLQADGHDVAPLLTDAEADLDAVASDVDSASDDKSAPEPSTVLSGRVVDRQGGPIAGVDVLFGTSRDDMWLVHWDFVRSGASGVKSHAVTGANGRFEVGAVVTSDGNGGRESPEPRLVFLHAAFSTTVRRCDKLPLGRFDIGDQVLDAGARLKGRVVTPGGEPVPEADVSVSNEAPALVSDPGSGPRDDEIRQWFLARRTPADGCFESSGLRPGAAGLAVAKRDLASTLVAGLQVSPDEPLDVGDIVLEAGSGVAGVVVDAQGLPLRNASVEIELAPETRRAAPPSANEPVVGPKGLTRGSAESADDGRFEVGGLTPGVYDVHVSLEGHAWSRVFDVPTGTSDLRVTMRRLGAILLQVVDEDTGEPVLGAEIKAGLPAAEKFQPWSDFQFGVESGENAQLAPGAYRVTGAGPEGTELTIRAEGHAERRETAVGVGADETATLTIRLRRDVSVLGVVVDDEGTPVAGARVSAGMPQHPVVGTAVSDKEGAFRLGGLASGDWELTASAPGFAGAGPLPLALPSSGLPEPFMIVLLRSGSIAGTVFDADLRPVAGLRVLAASRGEPGMDWRERQGQLHDVAPGVHGRLQTATSDTAGRYGFAELDPGRYVVWLARGAEEVDAALGAVWSLAPEALWERQVTYVGVAPAKTTHADLVMKRLGSIHGRVTAGGAAAPGSTLAVSPADIDYLAYWVRIAEHVQTDDVGNFDVSGLQPADYLVMALVEGAPVPRVERVRVGPGERVLADFAVRGRTVSGRVVDDPAGTAVPGLRIQIQGQADTAGNAPAGERMWPGAFANIAGVLFDRSGRTPFESTTDARGRFTARFLEPGEYTLRLSGGGYLPARTSFLVTDAQGPDELLVEMQRGAVIEGIVQPQGLSPLPKARAEIFTEDGRRQDSVDVTLGRFRFDAVKPGAYTVNIYSVFDVSMPLGSRAVTLSAAQVQHIVIVVEH